MTAPLVLQELYPAEAQEDMLKSNAQIAFAKGHTFETMLIAFSTMTLPTLEQKVLELEDEPTVESFVRAKRRLLEAKFYLAIVYKTFLELDPEKTPSFLPKLEVQVQILDEMQAKIETYAPRVKQWAQMRFLSDYAAPVSKALAEIESIVAYRRAKFPQAEEPDWDAFLKNVKIQVDSLVEFVTKHRENLIDTLLKDCRGIFFTQFQHRTFSLLYSWRGSIYVVMDVVGLALGSGETKVVCRAFDLEKGNLLALVKPRILFHGEPEEAQVKMRNRAFAQSWKESDLLIRLENKEGVIQLHERLPFEVDGIRHLFLLEDAYEDYSLEHTLAAVIRKGQKELEYSLSEKYAIAHQLLKGLCAIHDIGILHRDIKTDNVLLSLKDKKHIKAVLCDFNLACDVNDKRAHSNFAFAPFFCAPEYANAVDLNLGYNEKLFAVSTQKLDVWSMGIVFYLLFFFEPPPWDSAAENAPEQVLERVKSIQEGWIPRKWHSHPFYPLVEKMTKVNVNERLTSKQALLELERIII